MEPKESGMTHSKFLVDNAPSIAVVWVSVLALAFGWHMFTGRLTERTDRAKNSAGEVARIWGGPLMQPQPEVRWRRADAATVDLEYGELQKSDVVVDLDVDYRRRGITEYPGYDAKIRADYQFQNPSSESSF